MKKISAGILLICVLLSAYNVWAPECQRVIVVFHSTPDVDLLVKNGAHIDTVFTILPAIAATLPEPAVHALSKNPKINYIQKDYICTLISAGSPGTPEEQIIPWGVDRIDADLAWLHSTGEKVRVAIIDTGIDRDHPDLEANIKGGINTIAPDQHYEDPTDFDDDHGHGTFIAGICGAVNNTYGVIGVAPDAWLYGVKVLNDQGAGYTSDIIEGIQWCIDKKMQVINMSFGTGVYNPALEEACNAAWNHGILLVGSEGSGYISYPAAFPSVIAVAATDRNDYQGFEYGAELELVAPGEDILSTCLGGGYCTMSGVSLAAPHVAGTAALVIAIHPNYSNAIVRRILKITAEDLGVPGWDPYYGYGMVDAENAVLY